MPAVVDANLLVARLEAVLDVRQLGMWEAAPAADVSLVLGAEVVVNLMAAWVDSLVALLDAAFVAPVACWMDVGPDVLVA